MTQSPNAAAPAVTNGNGVAKPKTGGRTGPAEAAFAELSGQVKLVAWLFEEDRYQRKLAAIQQLRAAIAQQVLADPTVQQHIDAEVAAKMPMLGL